MHRRARIRVPEDPGDYLYRRARAIHHPPAGPPQVMFRDVEAHSRPKVVENVLDGAPLVGVQLPAPLVD